MGEDIIGWGYGDVPIILKSDQEHSIVALKRAIQGLRKGETSLE